MDEIESDLDHNRDQLGHTLEALEHKLSSGDMFERSMAYLRDSGGNEFAGNLRYSVTENPVPLGLVALGVTWLMVSGASQSQRADPSHRSQTGGSTLGDKASKAGGQGKSQGKAMARKTRDSVGGAARSGRDGMRSLSDGARKSASQAGAASRKGAERTRQGVDYMLREQPLVSAGIGLALGAILAAGLPRTRREDQFMGGQRDDLVSSAEATGREQATKAQRVAESALDAAGDAASGEADRQGFTGSR